MTLPVIASGLFVLLAFALVFPVIIPLVDKYYTAYCNWIWDQVGK